MASTDARPLPRKNTAYRLTFPIFDADGDLVTGATGLDSEVSIDGGTFADCTNEATEIATASGMYYLDLTSGEMNGDTVSVIVKTTSVGAKTTPIVMYPEELGDLRVDVGQVSGDATAADNLEALLDGTGGVTLVASAFTLTTPITANITQISGDATAADNAELAFDGTGFNVGAGAIVAASVTGNLGGAVVGNVGGNVVGSVGSVTGSVGSIAADGITSTSLAASAGAELADAVWDEALSGHSTAGTAGKALTDAAALGTPLDAAGVRAAIGLASANLDTQLSTIDDFLDTEVAAIKAKTDNLPSDPADASDIASSFTTVNTKLDTIDDLLDTEMPALTTSMATLTGYVDTEVAAIKAKTDSLTFTTAGKVDAKLTSDGLDSISAADPAGVASTFPQMVVQTWRWLFKRTVVDKVNGTIKTYADNNSTVRTTQTYTSDSSSDDRSAAT